jgi:hypothetical protein
MAVIQGTRLRSSALPAAEPIASRRRGGVATPRVGTGVHPTGLVMAGILVATMLGLAYLTQTLGSDATSTQLKRLEAQERALARDRAWQMAEMIRVTGEDQVAEWAEAAGLSKRDAVVVLEAP